MGRDDSGLHGPSSNFLTTEEYIWHSSVVGKQNGVLEAGNTAMDVNRERRVISLF
jgi:hypothetical protein